MRKFWQLLGEEFNVTFQCAKYGKAETAGSFLHLGGLLVNIEVKNEIGSGGGATHVHMLLRMHSRLTRSGASLSARLCS